MDNEGAHLSDLPQMLSSQDKPLTATGVKRQLGRRPDQPQIVLNMVENANLLEPHRQKTQTQIRPGGTLDATLSENAVKL